ITVRRQKTLHQIDTDAFGVMVIDSDPILFGWLAVTNVKANVLVSVGDFLQVFLLNVFATVARTEEKPNLALGIGLDNRIQHAKHRGDTDTAGNEHDRTFVAEIEKEMSARRL